MKPLANTTYAVLGLLSFGQPLSGYEIRKRAMQMKFFYWSPAQSQVYGELKKLEARDFVTAEKVEQENRPNKRVYQITEQGQAALASWLNDASVTTTNVMKHAISLKLYFGHAAEPEAQIAMLSRYVNEIDDDLAQLYVVQEFYEHMVEQQHQALVIEWGIHHLKSERAFASELIGRL